VFIEATEHTMRHLPGFISANIHNVLTSTRRNLAQGAGETLWNACSASGTHARTLPACVRSPASDPMLG